MVQHRRHRANADQNIEIARSVNRFYDLNGYHTPTGPGLEAARAPHTTGGPNLSRGFAFVDDNTRSEGSHHQKVSYIRNRYGDFAFVGGIDMVPRRWDTNMHLSPEERKPQEKSGNERVCNFRLARRTCDARRASRARRGQEFFSTLECVFARSADAYITKLSGGPNRHHALSELPVIPEEGVPAWPGPASDLGCRCPIDLHTILDRGPEGRAPRRAKQVCAVVRTIPPFIDAYDSFVKARPIPDNGEPSENSVAALRISRRF